jgi:hypothetical protein
MACLAFEDQGLDDLSEQTTGAIRGFLRSARAFSGLDHLAIETLRS